MAHNTVLFPSPTPCRGLFLCSVQVPEKAAIHQVHVPPGDGWYGTGTPPAGPGVGSGDLHLAGQVGACPLMSIGIV